MLYIFCTDRFNLLSQTLKLSSKTIWSDMTWELNSLSLYKHMTIPFIQLGNSLRCRGRLGCICNSKSSRPLWQDFVANLWVNLLINFANKNYDILFMSKAINLSISNIKLKSLFIKLCVLKKKLSVWNILYRKGLVKVIQHL